jgi:hypothetical protein
LREKEIDRDGGVRKEGRKGEKSIEAFCIACILFLPESIWSFSIPREIFSPLSTWFQIPNCLHSQTELLHGSVVPRASSLLF